MQIKNIFLVLGIALIGIVLINAASASNIKENSQNMHSVVMNADSVKSMHNSAIDMAQMHKQMHGEQNSAQMLQMHKQMHAGQTDKEIAEHCNSMSMEESK